MFFMFLNNFWVSKHFQPATGSIFDVETDVEGNDDQILQPGRKNTDEKLKTNPQQIN